MTEEIIFTSKGPRRRSQVRKCHRGTRVRRAVDSGNWEQIAGPGRSWKNIGYKPPPKADLNDDSSSWKSYASWTNVTGPQICWFAASWIVPPRPLADDGQTVFLFIGVEDIGHSHIVQPVLQWGPGPSGDLKGAWSIASYWVGGDNDPLFASEAVVVQPGDKLTGRMVLSPAYDKNDQPNGLVNCRCQFDGHPETILNAENLPPLKICDVTLESYNVSQAAPYPPVATTAFENMVVAFYDGSEPVVWNAEGKAEVNANGSIGAAVTVKYPSV